MLIEKHSLQSFLNKMTVLTAKGWLLHLDFSCFDTALYLQKSNLLNDLFQELQKNKICLVLEYTELSQIFLYFQENRREDIQPLLIKIQFLFGLSLNEKDNVSKTFYHVYHLTEDWQKLREQFGQKSAVSVSKLDFLVKKMHDSKEYAPFTLDLFKRLERNLSQTDVSSLLRRQSVCAILGQNRPVELFDEVYVPLADLQKALCPNVAVQEAPYLMSKLLETLDKRVLESISHHDGGAFRKNFSLNMMVKTLLSPEFENFNANVEDNIKSTIILEIGINDLFNDIELFLKAKDYVLNAGYQLCINSVTADLLPLLKKKRTDASFIKLKWTDSLLDQIKNETFLDAVKRNESGNIILSHVDNPKAIDFGQKIGINLFQGFYVQKFLYQLPKTRKS